MLDNEVHRTIYPGNSKSTWPFYKLFSQWQYSFQMKAALPLTERLLTASVQYMVNTSPCFGTIIDLYHPDFANSMVIGDPENQFWPIFPHSHAHCRAPSRHLSSCHKMPYMEYQQCIIKGLRLVLEGFVVTMHLGTCKTGSQIPRPVGRGIWRTVLPSLSALWQQTLTDRS